MQLYLSSIKLFQLAAYLNLLTFKGVLLFLNLYNLCVNLLAPWYRYTSIFRRKCTVTWLMNISNIKEFNSTVALPLGFILLLSSLDKAAQWKYHRVSLIQERFQGSSWSGEINKSLIILKYSFERHLLIQDTLNWWTVWL